MIPIEIELKNFLAYQDPGPLSLDGVHVVCLAGTNGAGKSSLLDAITWALWGKARSSSPDDLIYQGKEEMRVSLTFDLSDVRFKVIRQRKAGKRGASLLELQAWDQDEESWRGISEATIRATQQRIDELLKLNYETFVNSAFLVQGHADEFTTKTPGQRKQVLANILGLDSWGIYESHAKDRITESKAALQRLDGRLEEVERELSQRDAHEAELAEAEMAAHEAAEKLEAIEKQLTDLNQVHIDLETMEREIGELKRRTSAATKEVEEAERERGVAQSKSDKEAIQAVLEQVKIALAKIEPLQEQIDKLSQQRNELSEEVARLKGMNQALGPETEPLKKRVVTLKTATEPICPTCGQNLTEEHRAELLTKLEKEIEERRETYRSNHDRIQILDSQIAEQGKEVADLRSRLREYPALTKKVGELETALEYADEAALRVIGLAEKINRWTKEIQSNQERCNEIDEKAAVSKQRLQEAASVQREVDQLRVAKRMADERVGGARQKLAMLESLKKQQQDHLNERKNLAEDLGIFVDLREAFSKRGVPAMIIETVVPELEHSSNELLGQMTDGRMHVRIETQREIKTGELREALDIIIADELGSRPYEMYSGGEAFRINFAIRIALSRLLARRSGAQLRSLFIDEGFGTQDARGREQLIAAINTIQDDFDRIIVITHIDELKEAFPDRIEITKTPNGSLFQYS